MANPMPYCTIYLGNRRLENQGMKTPCMRQAYSHEMYHGSAAVPWASGLHETSRGILKVSMGFTVGPICPWGVP